MKEQLVTSGGSSLYQLMLTHRKQIWKENYVACIALEPWLNASPCMRLTRVFQIGVEGRDSPSVKGDGKFCWGRGFNLYGRGNLRRSNFDHSNLFQGQKQHSVNIERLLKSKLTWPVCTEYEVKIKLVQVQWLQLKMKFLVGYNMKIVI